MCPLQWWQNRRARPHFSKTPILAPTLCLRVHPNTPLRGEEIHSSALHSILWPSALDLVLVSPLWNSFHRHCSTALQDNTLSSTERNFNFGYLTIIFTIKQWLPLATYAAVLIAGCTDYGLHVVYLQSKFCYGSEISTKVTKNCS